MRRQLVGNLGQQRVDVRVLRAEDRLNLLAIHLIRNRHRWLLKAGTY